MKKYIKSLYMALFHPILFFSFHIRHESRRFFIKRQSHVKGIRQIAMGTDVQIGYGARIQFFHEDTHEKKLYIGDGSYICNRVSLLVGAEIEIGHDCLIASDVCIVSENHQTDPESTIPYGKQKLNYAPVRIGSNVWIGEKAMILPGVKIGKASIIGAGSVVTEDIPEYAIAAGNPANVIKRYDFATSKWVRVHV